MGMAAVLRDAGMQGKGTDRHVPCSGHACAGQGVASDPDYRPGHDQPLGTCNHLPQCTQFGLVWLVWAGVYNPLSVAPTNSPGCSPPA